MARIARLKKENGYWVAWIRGKKRSFGNVKKVAPLDAQRAFIAALDGKQEKKLDTKVETTKVNATAAPTVAQLVRDYLVWLADDTSECNAGNKRSILKHFQAFHVPRFGKEVRCLPATDLTPQDFQAYLKSRAAEVDAGTVWITWKALAACWNWGAGTKRGGGKHLPRSHRPFQEFECPPEPTKELLWGDLPTDKELTALLTRAKREGLYEILVVLAETGCRPGELAKARVKHFDEAQIVLHKHKTSKRQTDSKPRRICLQGRSLAVVKRLVDSRVSADAHILVRLNGSPWNISRLGHSFARLRGGVVREHLTLYSLRHWFISRAVRGGYPLLTIARAVGTSIKMIDKHYGHFAPSDIADMHASLARKLKTA